MSVQLAGRAPTSMARTNHLLRLRPGVEIVLLTKQGDLLAPQAVGQEVAHEALQWPGHR